MPLADFSPKTLPNQPTPKTHPAKTLAQHKRIRYCLYGASTLALFILLLVQSYSADRSGAAANNATTLSADFLHVQGLRAGNSVVLGGVEIGKVVKVSLQKPSMNVRVQIAVEKTLPVPADSVAVIRAQDLSGNMMLVIQPGGDEEILFDGDFFAFSREPIELPQLITTIVEQAEGNIAAKSDKTKNNGSAP